MRKIASFLLAYLYWRDGSVPAEGIMARNRPPSPKDGRELTGAG
jgi:hypothetical protein